MNDAAQKIYAEAVAEIVEFENRINEQRQRAKAYYLGYQSVEQMEDHLPWLETRFPEGAEL